MPRRIAPLEDVRAVLQLIGLLRKLRPHGVHAHTPKGGLLGMLAARAAGVPVRIYHMRGLPMMTASGAVREVLRLSEVAACRLAHRTLCISPSLREIALQERLCPPDRISVIAGGGNGTDATLRFNPDLLPSATREDVRRRLDIPAEATVMGFVGRLVNDKGVRELVAAWEMLREEFPSLHLLVAGRLEARDAVPEAVVRRLESDERIHFAGYVREMPAFYAAMDLLVLPTYREGLPNVPLEAAAMRLPVVATAVPGCVDAVRDGETGVLVPARDATALARELRTYLLDPGLRARHGSAGRERVLRDFRPEVICEGLYQEYLRLLRRHLPSKEAARLGLALSGGSQTGTSEDVEKAPTRTNGWAEEDER